jgi:hypothetical protein
MKVYKYRAFSKWAKNENLDELLLKEAINEIEQGLFDANLGGNLYKKRIRRTGRGKSGGYRTFIAFKQGDKAIFLFGFAKNVQENITGKELEVLQNLGRNYFLLPMNKIHEAVKIGELIEVL